MATISTTFTATGVGTQVGVRNKENVSYEVTGTFVATWVVEKSENGGLSWTQVATGTGTVASTQEMHTSSGNADAVFRFQCTEFTSGSMVTNLIEDVGEVIHDFKDRGGKSVLKVTESGIEVTGNQTISGSSSFSDSDFSITDDGDATKVVQFQASGVTTGTTRTLTVPDADLTLVGTAITQTLNNKTLAAPVISTAANFSAGSAAATTLFNSSKVNTTEGFNLKTIDESVDLASLGAKFKALTTAIPAGSVILTVQCYIETTVVAGGTTVKVGIGLSGGNVDKYGLTGDLVIATLVNNIPTWVGLTSAEQIDVCGVVTDGSALGDTNISAGKVRVKVVYIQAVDLVSGE